MHSAQSALRASVVLALVLAPVIAQALALLYYAPAAEAQAGWLEGWRYRRAVTINNRATATLTGYQVRVVLDTASIIAGGKMRSDCGDIRFTDSDGTTLLPYWIEPGTCNTPSTVIWVRVPQIPAGSLKTIYVYYGNPSATSASNPQNVFTLFDDFSGTSLDSSKWTWFYIAAEFDCGVGRVEVSNGILVIEARDGGQYTFACCIAVRSTASFNPPIAVGARLRAPNHGSGDRGEAHGFSDDTSTSFRSNAAFVSYSVGNMYILTCAGGTANCRIVSVTGPDPRAFLRSEVVWTPSRVVWRVDGVDRGSSSAYVPAVGLPVQLQAHSSSTSSSSRLEVDYVYVRSYVDPEPVASVSTTEEALPAILAAGKPVTLEATLTISPGDAIAPHLYDWYFTGASDYVETVAFGISSQPFTYTFGARKTLANYGWGYGWIVYKVYPGVWYGEFSATLENAGHSAFRMHLSDGGEFVMYTSSWGYYPFEDLAWHNVVFTYNGSSVMLYVDGQLRITVSVPTQRATTSSVLRVGWHGEGKHYPFYFSHVLLYSRFLTSTDVALANQRIIDASMLELFLDPTFYNSTHFLDLSGKNRHARGFGYVSRVPAENTWLWLVKGLHSDSLVHLMFFPAGSVVELYDSAGTLVRRVRVSGAANPAGLVEDYAIDLAAGTYTVKVYTCVSTAVYQNHGTAYRVASARYPPGGAVRLVLDTDAEYINYQIATDPQFTNIVTDATASATSPGVVNIATPVAPRKYYLRLRALISGAWSAWSNTVELAVDRLRLVVEADQEVASGSRRLDLSAATAVAISAVYESDSAVALALDMFYSVSVSSLGARLFGEVWWRVDVYSGATTASEPPGSGYTYRGTVYPISTHSYYLHGYAVPSGYSSAYILQVYGGERPYWAAGAGAPSAYYALVYQSMVYLPLSGTYTFEVYSDNGVRLYINGALVIDAWGSGAYWPRTASVYLAAGWHNVTVKHMQLTGAAALVVGVVMPNGTAVRPLRPAHGIQMKPPAQSYTPAYPSQGLAVYFDMPSTGDRRSFSVSLGCVGSLALYVRARDLVTGLVATSTVPIGVWDTVVIDSVAPVKPRFTVGEAPSLSVSAVYAYDSQPLQGSVHTNATAVNTVGKFTVAVVSVSDSLYGLRRFTGNTTTSVVFDKLVVQSYRVLIGGREVAPGSRVNTTAVLTVEAAIVHAYDGLALTDSNAVSVQIAGVQASYSNGVWSAPVGPPGAVGLRTYTVVTYAESALGVRLLDSPVFSVVYDSIAWRYSADLVNNRMRFTLAYAYDGAPLQAGRLCTSVGCASVSMGTAVVAFPRLANATVTLVNASDGMLVSVSPRAPLLHMLTAVDKEVSANIAATAYIERASVSVLPGLAVVRASAGGNVSVLLSAQLRPVLVKVNGVRTGSYVSIATAEGVNVVLTGLGSELEVVFSESAPAEAVVGAGPGGGVFIVGFADSYNLSVARVLVGLLVNGSEARPVSIYMGQAAAGPAVRVSYPMVPMLSFGYEGRNLTVYYVVALARAASTAYVRGHWVSPVAERFSSLYPVLLVLNHTAVVERFGVIPSDFARLVARGLVSLYVYGPYPARMLVTTIVVEKPTVIAYTGGRVVVSEGRAPGIVLRGFKGFRLSIAVGTVQLQNVEVSEDELVLSLPLGFTALLVVDGASKALSIIQMALPLPAARAEVPLIVPAAEPRGIEIPATGLLHLRYAIIAIALAGVALGAWRRTGDFGFGVALAGFAGAVMFLAMGESTAVSISAFIAIIGVALSIAERRP